ncbi:MAG: PAS domain-containing protein, partial [Actinomycetota bacterium]
METLVADIKEQERQRSLEQQELRRQRRLFDRAPCALLLVDERNVVSDANSAATTLWGAPRGWIVGKRLAPFFPHQDLDGALARTRRKGHASWEGVLIPRSDTSVGVVIQAAPIEDETTEDQRLYIAVAQLDAPPGTPESGR